MTISGGGIRCVGHLLVPALLLGSSAGAQDAIIGTLARYELESETAPRLRLARALTEVSGLTFDAQGHLFAHHDESAEIFELDPLTGEIVRRFRVGSRLLAGDFEGIASVGDRLFLVDSDGLMLEFRAGPDGARVAFRGIPTGLGDRCEVEGLTADPTGLTLLLACKTARERALVDRITIFAFSLESMALEATPFLSIPVAALGALDLPTRFSPSALDVDPKTGHLLLASARDETLVEIAPDGRVVAGRRLSSRRFPQIEGIAFGPEGDLLLASEGAGGRAHLTRFPPRIRNEPSR